MPFPNDANADPNANRNAFALQLLDAFKRKGGTLGGAGGGGGFGPGADTAAYVGMFGRPVAEMTPAQLAQLPPQGGGIAAERALRPPPAAAVDPTPTGSVGVPLPRLRPGDDVVPPLQPGQSLTDVPPLRAPFPELNVGAGVDTIGAFPGAPAGGNPLMMPQGPDKDVPIPGLSMATPPLGRTPLSGASRSTRGKTRGKTAPAIRN